MRRREFLALAGAAAALPRVSLAQQAAKVPRVALMTGGLPIASLTATGDPSWAALITELARLGFVEGQTVLFDRYLAGAGSAQETARSVVASAPDLIFSGGAATTAIAAMALTKTIPIVGVTGDPLGAGLVTNLAHPGGNVTAVAGTASAEAEAKNLALLVEVVRPAKRLAYLNAGAGGQFTPVLQHYVETATDAARRLGLSVTTVIIQDPADEAEYRRAFSVALTTKPDMIQFGQGTVITAGSAVLAKLALEARLPAISPQAEFARAGGLMSYGANAQDNYRKAAGYVALILQGAKPGDLPVLQPTVFDLIINQKTAKSIGITMPPSLLIQATEVIQ